MSHGSVQDKPASKSGPASGSAALLAKQQRHFFSGSHSQNMSLDFQHSLVERYSILHSSSHPVVQMLRRVLIYNLLDCSMPGFPVLHYLPEFAQTRVNDAIHHLILCCPLLLLSSSLSQHQGLFQWVNTSHLVAKVLEFQLQPQSFILIFTVDFLYD